MLTDIGTIYGIASSYKINKKPELYDDNSDSVDGFEFQREVYELARKHASLIESPWDRRTVLDYGCGSGAKLVRYFSYLDFRTVGVDLPSVIKETAQKREPHPSRLWLSTSQIWGIDTLKKLNVDVFIAADVIEHLNSPESLFEIIAMCGNPLVIISTPARDLYPLYYSKFPLGPPENKAHIREWTYLEFDNWLMNYFEYHELQITSYEHCTMTAIGWLKEKF